MTYPREIPSLYIPRNIALHSTAGQRLGEDVANQHPSGPVSLAGQLLNMPGKRGIAGDNRFANRLTDIIEDGLEA